MFFAGSHWRAKDVGDLLGIFYFPHAVYDNGLGEVEIFSISQGQGIYAKIAQFLPDLIGNAACTTAVENFNADIVRDLGASGTTSGAVCGSQKVFVAKTRPAMRRPPRTHNQRFMLINIQIKKKDASLSHWRLYLLISRF